jgi:autotransporter-associated beta strand protein
VATPVIQNTAPTGTPPTADLLVTTTVTRDAANTVNSLTFAPGATLTADTPPSSTLVVTSGSLFVRPGGAAAVTGVTLAAAAGTPFTAFTYSDLTAGTLTAGAGLTKAGPANLTLTGPATATGGLQVVGGTLTLNADATAGSLAGSGGVTIGPGATLTLTGSGDSFTGPLAGAGHLVRTTAATGTQTLAAVNTTGDIETRAGTLRLTGPVGPAAGRRLVLGDNVPSLVPATLAVAPGLTIDRNFIVTNFIVTASNPALSVTAPGAPVTFTGPVTLNRALQVTGPVGFSAFQTTVTFAGAVSGPGQIIVDNANVNLSVANPFTGGVALASDGVTLGIGADGALGIFGLSLTANTAYLRADNGPRTVASPVLFTGGSSYLGLVGTNSLTFTGPMALNGRRSVANTVRGAVLTLGDVIGTGFSELHVNDGTGGPFGPGPVRLAGTASYAGATTVERGPFLVDGTLTRSTNPFSDVTVGTFATLGGTGTINRPVTVGSLATLAPGDSTGVLSVTRAVTMAAGSTFAIEADGPNPGAGGYSQLNLAGGGSISLGGATLTLTLGSGYTPADATHGDTLTIISGASSIVGQFAQGTSILVNNQYPAQILYGQTPGTVQVQFQPVPEPAHLLLVCAAAMTATAWRRARSR